MLGRVHEPDRFGDVAERLFVQLLEEYLHTWRPVFYDLTGSNQRVIWTGVMPAIRS